MAMKKALFSLLVLFNITIPKSAFDLNYVYPEDMHGWFRKANRHHLEDFIRTIKPKKVVEIGTWLGVSAIFMAKLLPAGSIIYCIDPWVPYQDMEGMKECQKRFKNAYERFLSNCIHHKVTDKIVPLRMTSMQAVDKFTSDIDLIYIDGSHQEEDVYNDIIYWYPKLSSRGIMCGDDIGWPGVHAALLRATPLLNVTFKRDEGFWWLEGN